MNLTAKAFPFGLGKLESHRLAAALGLVLLGWGGPVLFGATFSPLYTFTNGVDGTYPSAGLVRGSDGFFYGTTDNGGTSGDGTVFKINKSGVLTTLYSFTNGVDGALVAGPRPPLCQGPDGFFYGTTFYGGTHVNGNIYRISSSGDFKVLYSFTNGADGACPCAGVILGGDGSFYGTTAGSDGRGPHPNWGSVFKFSAGGGLTSLYFFTNGVDGANPSAPLVEGRDGNFYGTTENGGSRGDGVIFKITRQGALTPLYSFTNGVDGAIPTAALTQAKDGNFYGTTYAGGAKNVGSFFKITPSGQFTPLYSFTNGLDCAGPFAGVIQGQDGDFYGMTRFGGAKQAGGIFGATATGKLTQLYTFTNAEDGERPYGGLVQDSDGIFYGTTEFGGAGGAGAGTFFRFGLHGLPIIIAAPTPAPVRPVVPNPAPAPALAAAPTAAPLKTKSVKPAENLEKSNPVESTASLGSHPLPELVVDLSPAPTPPPIANEGTTRTSLVATPTSPQACNCNCNCRCNLAETNIATAAPLPPPQPARATPPPLPTAVLEPPSLTPAVKANAISANVKPATPVRSSRRSALALQEARIAGTEGTGLRLRADASLTSWVITVMPDGSQVTLLGETLYSGGYRWQKVQYGNRTGWAVNDYLVFGVAVK